MYVWVGGRLGESACEEVRVGESACEEVRVGASACVRAQK